MLARGVKPVAIANLPRGFVIDPERAPIWLNQASELGVFGTLDHKSLVLGLSGPQYSNLRTLTEDFSAAAPKGQLLDAAASPDGMAIASAFAISGEHRVSIVARDIVDSGAGRPLASFDGKFDRAQLQWLPNQMIAVSLGNDEKSGRELFMITTGGQPQIRRLDRIACTLTRLSFSPDGRMAIAQGNSETPPYLIDLHSQSCERLDRREPIRVLGWAFDDSSLLYVAHGSRAVTGVFRYDCAARRSVVIAISSGTAAYASDGTIVALGSSWLTWRNAAESPNKLVQLQIARWVAGQAEIQINSAGIATLPPMLEKARMVFSSAADAGVIDLEIPAAQGAQRELVGYSYAIRALYLIASGAADAPLAISWAPDGKSLVIVDGGARPAALIDLAPR